MIDLERARRETLGCEHVTHLNNAGASLMPGPVLRAVTGHLELEGESAATKPQHSERRRGTTPTTRSPR
jgi:cysteine desulfurase / selenocysteine lyase